MKNVVIGTNVVVWWASMIVLGTSLLLATGFCAETERDRVADAKDLGAAVELAEQLLDANVVNALKEKDESLAFSSFRDPRFAMQLRNDWHLGEVDAPLTVFFGSLGIYSNHLMMQIILEALRAKALKEEYDLLGALRRKYLQYSIEGNAPVVAWKTMPSGFYISQNILIGDLKGALACVHVAIDPLKIKL